ncbi:hypothetical protein PROFUN_09056 [Planoprotostelium fungivorum]|uniref:Cyclin N-terminal domain-containing protein n=1 Tax=Planoprotostelium fungivorum TaxID=1890364 RepID=A0A2P6NIE9_9EUKA|nr:hypothetical protein PROFUN_09056 [Planoprotostelium fungivorum]
MTTVANNIHIDHVGVKRSRSSPENRSCFPFYTLPKPDYESENVDEGMAFFIQRVNSWLKYGELSFTAKSGHQTVNMISHFIQACGYNFTMDLLLPVVAYCDRFVAARGTITRGAVPSLVCLSCMVTLKFWMDPGTSLYIAASFLRVSWRDMPKIEAEFLRSIDYRLFMKDEDIETYSVLKGLHRIETRSSNRYL